MTNDCVFSSDRVYRYSLLHTITTPEQGHAKIIAWIGLNPSTADEQQLDPTLRRIRAFTEREGGTAFVMLNLFAFRATDPNDMRRANRRDVNVVGASNDDVIKTWASVAIKTIACWGTGWEFFPGRAADVRGMLGARGATLLCLGRTQEGHPCHPLYLPKHRQLVPL